MRMNYTCFLKDIEARVAQQMGEDYDVELQSMTKNNGVKLDSMVIRHVGELICPNIYLRQFYEQYLDGVSMEDVCEHIISGYHDSMPGKPIDPEMLINPESVRENVVYRLINYDKNKDLLSEIPHKQFLDLALVYYVMVHAGEIGEGAILVNRNIMKFSNLTIEQIDEAARCNTKKILPSDFVKITDLLKEFGEKAGAASYDEIELEEESSEMALYVLTNIERQYGAYYMADMDTLSDISERLDGDFYILPSSVHECMVLPAFCWDEPKSLAMMVQEINRTQVSEEEFLADTVYLFRSEEKSLQIVA